MSQKKLGLYAYCIVNTRPPAGEAGLKISARGGPASGWDQLGINDKHKVYPISYKNLSALVSQVSLSDFGEREIKKNLKDMEWTKKMVVAHEMIVETLMKTCQPLLPMKFCTIFKGNKQVEGILKNRYVEFRQTLSRLKDKEEWGIKMYGKIPAEGKAKRKSSKGADYLLLRKKEDEIEKKAEQEMMRNANKVHRQLEKYAFSSVVSDLLPKKATGKTSEMMLNTAYLVPKEKLTEFKDESKRLQEEYGKLGFEINFTGPWPPYNFL